MADPSQPTVKLDTWPQIAAYLGISVREAQYRAKDEGLPVHHGPGKKGRVWAFQQELDAWKAEMDAAGLRVPDGATESASDSPVALEAGGDASQPVPLSPAPSLLSRRNILLGTGVALGGALVTGASLGLWRPREIAALALDGPILVARDTSGKELWRHLFSDGLYEAYYQLSGYPAWWIGDLDGDGHSEALFRYDSAKSAGMSSSLFCFSRTGDVKWVFNPGHVVRDSGGEIIPRYRIPSFQVSFSATPERQARIAVGGGHPTDQPFQIAFLDPSGKLVAEYWHPGQLWRLAETRAAVGGAPRLLAGGVNNGEHCATLVMLDPFAMKGATTPSRMKDQHFRLLDMPEAQEEAVILFPRSCLSEDEPYTRLDTLEADEQAVRVRVVESAALTKRVIFYEFDPSLVLRRAFLSTEYRQEHAKLEQSGELSHTAAVDEAELARGVEIRRKRS